MLHVVIFPYELTTDPLLQWLLVDIRRSRGARFTWQSKGPLQNGSLAQLAEAATHPAILLLPGSDVVIRHMSFSAPEKRHLNRVMRFALEPDVAADIDDLHVSLGRMEGDQVTVAYTDREGLEQRIAQLEASGIEVAHCYHEGQLLPVADFACRLHLEDGVLTVRHGPDQVLTLEQSLIPWFLADQANNDMQWPPQPLALSAPDAETCAQLQALLAASDQWSPLLGQATQQRLSLRDAVISPPPGSDRGNEASAAEATDLRRGELEPPLRWQRYRRPLMTVAGALTLAVATVMVSATVELQVNNSRLHALQQQIEASYRAAMPSGVLVDAEQQLLAQLSRHDGERGGSALLPLLVAAAPILQNAAEDGGSAPILLHRLGYDTRLNELQLSVSADSNSHILAMSSALDAIGLNARAQNISQSAGRQQASLLVSGTAGDMTGGQQ